MVDEMAAMVHFCLPMASRADRHKPQGYVAPVRRQHVGTSLPEGLEHYEFKRVLEPFGDQSQMWRYAIQYDADGLPCRDESSPPPFQPLDLDAFFGRAGAPFEIEIGIGKGSFLVPYSAMHPEINLLGIEWTIPIALHALERLCRQGGPNAKILAGDAPFFLRDRLPLESVDAFHIYFPDPWPKEKARKRRIMQPGFLAILKRCAKPGATLYWGTDHEEYNASTLELLGATDGFVCTTPEAGPTEGLRTNFESKYIREGRPIYRSIWTIK
jgi:tRNA (guanine-N7-)-methyltransferase